MPRYKLTLEYDGSPYSGWQRQPDHPSVQQALEDAIKRFCGEAITIRAAGRTDAGVHASGQVAHVDFAEAHATDTIRDALNFHLKQTAIAVLSAEKMDENFDARFSALERHYLYRFQSRRAPSILLSERVWWVPKPLDVDAMHKAAQLLVGTHDFTTFRASECQAKSPVKTINRIAVETVGAEIHLTVSARSFLHNQIRSFAGSLKLVGEGRWSSGDLRTALEAQDRKTCGPVAPPQGLYLTRVDY